MARSLHVLNLSMQNPSFSPLPVNLFFVLLAVFSMFSLITFLCASHKTRRSQKQREESILKSSDQKLFSKINSNLSSKAQLMVKMISWRKVEAEEDDDDETEEAVWRKKIMMGERCRPWDFSGKILYDSEGNLLSHSDPLNKK